MNVVGYLEMMAAERPNLEALKTPVRTSKGGALHYKGLSFNELSERVLLASAFLCAKGVNKEANVLLLVPPGETLLVLTFALLKIGAIPIIIDPGMGLKNFVRCLKNTNPSIVIGGPKIIFYAYFLGYFLKNLSLKIVVRQSLLSHLVEKGISFDIPGEASKGSTAAVLFTSGSTGRPKGACYTHKQFNAQIETLKKAFHIQVGEVDLPLLPVFSLFNPALGMTTVVPEMNPTCPSQLNPAYIVESIENCQVTNSFGSPRLWTKIADYCEKSNCVLPTLKRVFLAGAPVSPRLLSRIQALLPNGEAYTPYGATEALPLTCISAKEVLQETFLKTIDGKGTCVGRPLPEVDIRILPISEGALNSIESTLPPYEIGEIVVSGPMVSEGYLNDPAADQQSKIREKNKLWHRMGDLGYLDSLGRLWFCGRKAERVICSKGNFYTDCCEPIFNTHPSVFRSALIGLRIKEAVVPAIVVEPLQAPFQKEKQIRLLEELKDLAQKHATTRAIDHFFIHKSFPVDVRHNAKIHRLALALHFSKRFF